MKVLIKAPDRTKDVKTIVCVFCRSHSGTLMIVSACCRRATATGGRRRCRLFSPSRGCQQRPAQGSAGGAGWRNSSAALLASSGEGPASLKPYMCPALHVKTGRGALVHLLSANACSRRWTSARSAKPVTPPAPRDDVAPLPEVAAHYAASQLDAPSPVGSHGTAT